MAGYECALCGGEEQAALLITPLTGGETMPVGESCMAVAFAGMLAGHLGVDADKLWAACERLVKKAAAAQAGAAAVPSITPPSGDASPREDPARRHLGDEGGLGELGYLAQQAVEDEAYEESGEIR